MEMFGYRPDEATALQSDNMVAIHLTTKSIFQNGTKHIKIKHRLIQEILERGSFVWLNVPRRKWLQMC